MRLSPSDPMVRRLVIGVVALIAVIYGALTATDDAVIDADQTSRTSFETSETGPDGQFSDLDTIGLAQLPPEALDTLDLIEQDGPYPFDRDGLTFQNREGLLPDHPRGHYREFTVITPGSDDRGARRIVAGADGARYYTDDHYQSFREILYEQDDQATARVEGDGDDDGR